MMAPSVVSIYVLGWKTLHTKTYTEESADHISRCIFIVQRLSNTLLGERMNQFSLLQQVLPL